MNDVLKNVDLFISILGMSRSIEVQKWDKEAFQRAFRWAQYFEQVYKKSKSKPQVADKIRNHLQTICVNPEVKLGTSVCHYEDLSKASEILCRNLLQNPFLGNEFYLQLFTQCQVDSDKENHFVQQARSLSKLKATLQILQLVQRRFETSALREKASTSTSKPVAESKEVLPHYQLKANAVLLRKCLSKMFLPESNLPDEAKNRLYKKLSGILKHQYGEDIILLSLTVVDDTADVENDHLVTEFLMQFLDEVIIETWRQNWTDFLKLPLSVLLAKTADLLACFRVLYYDLLKVCGDKIQEEAEKHDYMLLLKKSDCEANEKVCTDNYLLLLDRFKKLYEASPDSQVSVRSYLEEQSKHTKRGTAKLSCNVWRSLFKDVVVQRETSSKNEMHDSLV